MEELPGIIIVVLRLIVPFTILRWPLAGVIASTALDGVDVMVFQTFPRPFEELFHYHTMDKFFDIYYYFFAFLIVRRWRDNYAKTAGSVLFIWRLVGYVFVQITGNREFFFYAPNIFEFFYLYYLIARKFNPKFKFDKAKLVAILLIVGIPNIIKEYYMHYQEFETWAFFRENLFWWLYR